MSLSLVFPRFVGTVNETAVTKDNNVTLNCSATGHPKPVITWKFKGGCVLAKLDSPC